MHRVLKRPMFRRGGSTGGITSGLRQGYREGLNVENIERDYTTLRPLIDKYTSPRSSGMNDFLISTGLDLVSRPAAGNIFQQVATSAKKPYDKWMERKAGYAAEEDKTTRALLGDLLEYEKDIEIAKIKDRDDTSYEFSKKFSKIENTVMELKALEAQLGAAEKGTGGKEGVPPNIDPVPSVVDQEKITDLTNQIEAKQRALAELEGVDPRTAAIMKTEGFESIIDEIIDELTKELGRAPSINEIKARMARQGAKEGGRIGYQNAGAVIPAAMPNQAPGPMDQVPGPMDQGSVPMDQGAPVESGQVQQLTYVELRARLPKSITDDVVKLLADSEQALIDFAAIRSQQDIDTFNLKYGVDLVMPQEV